MYITYKPALVSVPHPQLTLTITPSTTPLYEGTPVNLTCSATLHTSTPVTVSIVWTGPSGEQLTSSSRITVMDMLHSSPYTSVVVFDQVDDTDSGDYQCNIIVSQNSNNPNILPSMISANNNLNITSMLDALTSYSIVTILHCSTPQRCLLQR